jgi:hypothetical protein
VGQVPLHDAWASTVTIKLSDTSGQSFGGAWTVDATKLRMPQSTMSYVVGTAHMVNGSLGVRAEIDPMYGDKNPSNDVAITQLSCTLPNIRMVDAEVDEQCRIHYTLRSEGPNRTIHTTVATAAEVEITVGKGAPHSWSVLRLSDLAPGATVTDQGPPLPVRGTPVTVTVKFDPNKHFPDSNRQDNAIRKDLTCGAPKPVPPAPPAAQTR